MENGLTDSGVVALLVVCECELVKLLLQAYKFVVVGPAAAALGSIPAAALRSS